MDKLKMHSPDLSQDNISKISALFPSCVTETKNESGELKLAIDFDLLKQELSDSIVEGPQERYHLNWPGKREALLTANAPIAKTLRPCREESVNFDTTENLFIEGDNLEALKLLQETYLGKVKMIYIDPPYNTGKDFVYKDDFAENSEKFLEKSNQIDEEKNRLISNTESNGRFHSYWLSMIYTRLKLARNLLAEDGVIVVHIDENEYTNLEKILTEIFGEVNNVGSIVWDKRNPKGKVAGTAQQHELISIYCKNKSKFAEEDYFYRRKENADAILKKAKDLIIKSGTVNDKVRNDFKKWVNSSKLNFSGGEKAYSNIDDNGNVFQPVSMAAPDKPETRSHRPLIHPVTKKPCPVPEKGWRFHDKSMDVLVEENLIVFGTDEMTQPRRKYLLKENIFEAVPSLLYFGGSDDALGLPFDNPKPVKVATKLIDIICNGDDIVMDFFAGSATTGHAVLNSNAVDDGNRKFILVQLNEECTSKSIARKKGFNNIADISKERLKRAAQELLSDAPNAKVDTGFRVLKIDNSNMTDIFYRPDEITQADMFAQVENIKEDRTDEDLLFQVLLDWGVGLTLPIAKQQITSTDVYFVNGDEDNEGADLVACFAENISNDLVKSLAEKQPLRVVFRDDGFVNDSVKINVEQIFKQISPITDIKSI